MVYILTGSYKNKKNTLLICTNKESAVNWSETSCVMQIIISNFIQDEHLFMKYAAI